MAYFTEMGSDEERKKKPSQKAIQENKKKMSDQKEYGDSGYKFFFEMSSDYENNMRNWQEKDRATQEQQQIQPQKQEPQKNFFQKAGDFLGGVKKTYEKVSSNLQKKETETLEIPEQKISVPRESWINSTSTKEDIKNSAKLDIITNNKRIAQIQGVISIGEKLKKKEIRAEDLSTDQIKSIQDVYEYTGYNVEKASLKTLVSGTGFFVTDAMLHIVGQDPRPLYEEVDRLKTANDYYQRIVDSKTQGETVGEKVFSVKDFFSIPKSMKEYSAPVTGKLKQGLEKLTSGTSFAQDFLKSSPADVELTTAREAAETYEEVPVGVQRARNLRETLSYSEEFLLANLVTRGNKAGSVLANTGLFGLGRLIDDFADRVSNEKIIKPTEDGFVMAQAENGLPPSTALISATANSLAQNTIEVIVGDLTGKALGGVTKMFRKPLSKAMGKVIDYKAVTSKMASSKVLTGITKFFGSSGIKSKAFIDGFPGEYAEELIGKWVDQISNGESPSITAEEAKETAVNVAIGQVFFGATNFVGSSDKVDVTKEDLDKLPPKVKEEVENVIKDKDEITNEDVRVIEQNIATKIEGGEITLEQYLYSGSEGKVEKALKEYESIKKVQGDQKVLLQELADKGDELAAQLLYDKDGNVRSKINYAEVDYYLQSALKNEYDAIEYTRTNIPEQPTEVHDLQENKFYSDNEYLAKDYANQTRGEKYNTAEFKKFAQSVDLAIEERLAMSETEKSAIGNYEKTEEVQQAKPFKIANELLGLADKYDALLTERFTKRGALGTYTPKTNLTNIRGINDLSTFVHELTHRVDAGTGLYDKLSGSNLFKELKGVYLAEYPGGRESASKYVKTKEGLAMLVERFIEQPSQTKEKYGGLVKEILTPGGTFYDKTLGEFIKDSQNIVKKYQGLDAIDQILAYIEPEEGIAVPKKNGIFSAWDRISSFFQDGTRFFERLSEINNIAGTAGDPAVWLNMRKSFVHLVMKNVTDTKSGFWTLDAGGEFYRKYDFNWATITEELNKLGKRRRERFNGWIIARDQYYQYERLEKEKSLLELLNVSLATAQEVGVETEAQIEEVARLNKAIAAKQKTIAKQKKILQNNKLTKDQATVGFNRYVNDEQFKEISRKIDVLTKENLNLMSHQLVQLISPQDKRKLLNDHKGYARMSRVFIDNYLPSEAVESFNYAQAGMSPAKLKERVGGSYIIRYPLAGYIVGSMEIYQSAFKQIVLNKIAHADFERIDPTLIRKIPYSPGMENNKDIIVYRDAYKRQAMMIDPFLKSVVEDYVTPDTVDMFTKIGQVFARVFQAGTTGTYPLFALTNYFFLDAPTSYMLSKNDYKPFLDSAKNLGKAFKKGSEEEQYWKEYLALAGDYQTSYGWHKTDSYETIKKSILNEAEGIKKAVKAMSKAGEKGLDILSAPGKYSEYATRATEYIKARKNGKSQIESLTDAGNVSGSFYKRGLWRLEVLSGKLTGGRKSRSGLAFIRTIPYMNPSIQIFFNTINAVRKDRKARAKFIVLTSAYSAAAIASAVAISGGSDEQKRQLLDKDPELLANYLYFPKLGGKGLIKIRVPSQFGWASAMVNMVTADILFQPNKNRGFKDYMNALTAGVPEQFNVLQLTRLALSWLPHVISTNFAIMANVRTWPEIKPLEQEYMKNMLAKDRVYENTSWLAKQLGKIFNASPIKIDAFLEGNLGRTVRYLTLKGNIYNPVESLFYDKYVIGYSKELQELKGRADEIDSVISEYKAGTREMNIEEYEKLSSEKKSILDIQSMVREYSGYIKDKDETAAEILLPNIFKKIDQHSAGQYVLDEEAEKDLLRIQEKLVASQYLVDSGFPEVTSFILETRNDKKLNIIKKMYAENPSKADTFIGNLAALGLITSEFRKMLIEEALY